MKHICRRLLACGVMVFALCGVAHAEANQVRFARQLGLGYLQFYVMQDKQMLEKQAERAGLGKVTATYAGMGTPTAITSQQSVWFSIEPGFRPARRRRR